MSTNKEAISDGQSLLAQPKVSRLWRKIPLGQRREVAALVFVRAKNQGEVETPDESSPANPRNIPATVIFPSDGIDFTCRRLWRIATTPDLPPLIIGSSKTDPIALGLMLHIRRIAPQRQSLIGPALSFIKVALGREREEFELYQDLARSDPDCATEWLELLVRQFGSAEFSRAERRYRGLFCLLEDTRLLAKRFLDDSSVEKGPTSTDLPYDIESYQRQAYLLRGLDPPVSAIDITASLLGRLYP